MDSPLIGKRVRLLWTDDQWTHLVRGDEGTVNFIDDAGTVFVKWDRGSNLGLVRNHDRYEVIS